mmetsp:Transcript_13664/g.41285  ORF Transcript_13664/g.41285 Transcript_13664/m.41285 type:complete len:517 (-) Transcript_13664:1353-2903(-)|eukprot:CAMPEP_0206137624 /NCGR_PEP_ID=MMETSP1473-20131121/2715_1 /ASSEMBLY_ACC=CAM_ASM_001109 /TAXON_ID=1461547 /ORGANISM="Stichococcus sp, Strain RCC1054" /LENGTH=516 /DNA_ID=CAMNT_0053530805 /DNA_START=94 /DNA_END=1644 /DNA_ORIENTATION=+
MAELEVAVLRHVHEGEGGGDSAEVALAQQVDHLAVIGAVKSLESAEMITAEGYKKTEVELTADAKIYAESGSPEAHVYSQIPAEGISIPDLQKAIGGKQLPKDTASLGQRQAMAQKWVSIDRATKLLVRQVDSIEDTVQQQLQRVAAGKASELSEAEVKNLTKRKLLAVRTWTAYRLARGPKFALERKKQHTDLTVEMLRDGTWEKADFKAYNYAALCPQPLGGYLHPLLKVRSQFRKIFMQMGFEEMPTNAWLENSFWNFDSLFQPQQHPARDAHDTFFLTTPATTSMEKLPQDYVQVVRNTHERGIDGSRGYESYWKTSEAAKNLLRTHTTAVSARMLYRLAKICRDGTGEFQPAKYFSIDRVFRNEAIDRTHLAEFHQVEGVVCDRGLTLGNLIGMLREFFKRMGMPELRFKPAYNPYTEPSMEIFGYSNELGKWMELGNSGMFRPEMLRPMGFPEDVNVIAWGLSLERPTMILNKMNNIRDLFGHKVSLAAVGDNPVCRLGFQGHVVPPVAT